MDDGKTYTLIDVRTRLELTKIPPLPEAIHIPIDSLRQKLEDLDPEQETILYCAQGLRSYLGNRILLMNGFERVRTLSGGLENWMYELESSDTTVNV